MSFIRNLLTPKRPAAVPRGLRVYAVGDIHGRDDLLRDLLRRIDEDRTTVRAKRDVLVFLGDYIDRGPSSCQVIDRLQRLWQAKKPEAHFLIGNHEEVLLRVLGGRMDIFADWMRFGGREFLQSYGLDPDRLSIADPGQMTAQLRHAIPRRHREFLKSLVDTVRIGDYLFVHAGLRPGVPLAAQSQSDLRWIRSAFLDDEQADHGAMIVHGHTVTAEVDWRANRIGIDTGAHASGTLTALVLEGSRRRLIQTRTE